MKPLCIDLFCGLTEPELFRGTDSSVQKFMASRAENPDHIRLGVFHFPPRSISLVFRFMGELQHAVLSAGLTLLGQIGMSAPQPANDPGVLVRPMGIINSLNPGILFIKGVSLLFGGNPSTLFGAIAAIRGRRGDGEMLPAFAAVGPVTSYIRLLFAAQSAYSALAPERAVHLVRSLCTELFFATFTK